MSSGHTLIHSFTRSFVHQLFRELPLLAGGGRTDSLCSPGSDSSARGGSSESLSPVFRPPRAPTFPEAPFCLSSRPDLHAHCPLHLESAALLAHWPLFLLPPPPPAPGCMCRGCSFPRTCRGDMFGGPGCLAGKIHHRRLQCSPAPTTF